MKGEGRNHSFASVPVQALHPVISPLGLSVKLDLRDGEKKSKKQAIMLGYMCVTDVVLSETEDSAIFSLNLVFEASVSGSANNSCFSVWILSDKVKGQVHSTQR